MISCLPAKDHVEKCPERGRESKLSHEYLNIYSPGLREIEENRQMGSFLTAFFLVCFFSDGETRDSKRSLQQKRKKY